MDSLRLGERDTGSWTQRMVGYKRRRRRGKCGIPQLCPKRVAEITGAFSPKSPDPGIG